ncbi:hypothetical protein D3C73_1083000 [compost metagenome]
MAGAPRVDVQATAAGIAGFHFQPLRPAARRHLAEDALDALLVELGVLAVADQVAQQAGTIDLRAAITQADGGPVRLAGNRAVGLQQGRDQGLLHQHVGIGRQVVRLRRAIAVDVHVKTVDQLAQRRLAQRRQAERDLDRGTGAGRKVGDEALAQGFGAVQTGAVERVQIQLERLRLDQPRRGARHLHGGDGDLRFATRVEPAQLEGVPAVVADERQRGLVEADLGAGADAGDGKQQAGIVLRRVTDLATEAGILWGVHGAYCIARRAGLRPGRPTAEPLRGGP